MIHAQIQEFSSGGGGGGGGGGSRSIWRIKKALTIFFLFLFFFSPKLILQNSKKTSICQGSSGVGTFSRVSNFLQGG